MRFSGLVAFLLLSSTTEARFNLRRLDRDRTRGGRGAAPSPGGSSTGGSTRPLPKTDGSRVYRFNTTPDLAPKDGDVDIPDPELAPNVIDFAPGGPGNTGDVQDSPNVDGGDALPDLPPRQDVPQDPPPPEDGFESFTPPPGDQSDTPGTDGGDGVEIPAMEPIPDPLPGNRDSDLPADLPSEEDGFLSFAPPPGDNQDSPGNDGGVDVPEMEPIADPPPGNRDSDLPVDLPSEEDGFLSFAPPPGDNQDSPGNDGGVDVPEMEPIADPPPSNRDSDLPVDLPSGEDGFLSFAPPPGDNQDSPGNDGGVDVPEMEPEPASAGRDGPVVLPFGAEAERYILGHTASVCAPDLAHAEAMCATLPICKYKNQGTELVSHQGDCVRRCDKPVNGTQCSNHEACHHFVLGC